MPYSNGYNFRVPVVIFATRLVGALTNFPLAFFGTYQALRSRANGGQVFSGSAFDVIFTSDAAGSTILPFERVFNDLTTGTVEYHVNVPSISTTLDTTIYLFAGNASITSDQSNKTAVWDSNYKGVWHFGDGVTLDCSDSTSNANNGTNHSATAYVAWMGGAAYFDKSLSAYIDVGSGSSLTITGDITIESAKFWADFPIGSSGIFPTIFSKRQFSPDNGYFVSVSSSDTVFPPLNPDSLFFDVVNAGTSQAIGDTGPGGTRLFQPDIRAFTFNNTSGFAKDYWQGIQIGNQVSFGAGAIGTPAGNANIGRIEAYPTVTLWNGWLDEVRVSNAVRSDDYIQATFLNQYHPTSFFTLGTPGAGSGSLYCAARR